MFDDNDHRPIRVIGTVVFEFAEDENGTWHGTVSPDSKVKSTVHRDIYKMALITAVLIDTCNKKLDAIDRMIMNNEEIKEYHNTMVAEKQGKPPADVDLYQTKLPFDKKKKRRKYAPGGY